MCKGIDCPLKESCYRYTAKPSEFRQSYFVNPPYSFANKSCDMYWCEKLNQLKDITK